MSSYQDIILAPVVTEKTANLSADGKKVVFKVAKSANKVQIKQAIEKIFNVKVENVNTVNVRPKKKRVGRYEGATKAYKKAYITLAEGSKLDLN
jgi:large subunit ribosomal protein L23